MSDAAGEWRLAWAMATMTGGDIRGGPWDSTAPIHVAELSIVAVALVA